MTVVTFADIGQSAIITLVFPYGAKNTGMGEVGTALADDMGVSYYNPAGLGIENEDFRYGFVGNFFEPLLPAFDIPGLWHYALATYTQLKDKRDNIYGFGLTINYLNFGGSYKSDGFGNILGEISNSYEYVINGSFGLTLVKNDRVDFSGGLNLKYAKSALDPTLEAGVARGFAIDLGLLTKFSPGINVGLNIMNMGPAVYYSTKSEADPIPFTIRIGLGYEKEFQLDGMRIAKIKTGYDLEKELVYHPLGEDPYPFYKALFRAFSDQPISEEFEEIVHHTGVEVTVFNTGSFRVGFLRDVAGSRLEKTIGFGVNILNHIEMNYSIILAKYTSKARHRQWRLDLVIKGIGNRKESNKKWYLVE